MRPRPGRGCPGVALDHAALVRTHLGQRIERAPPQLGDLIRQRECAAGHAEREDELDPLPAKAGDDLEHRTDLDREAGLLGDLARQGVLHALALPEEPAEEPPLRRAEAMAREEHAPLSVDAQADNADEELVVRDGHEPTLPAHRKTVEEKREPAHQHGRKTRRAWRSVFASNAYRARCARGEWRMG